VRKVLAEGVDVYRINQAHTRLEVVDSRYMQASWKARVITVKMYKLFRPVTSAWYGMGHLMEIGQG